MSNVVIFPASSHPSGWIDSRSELMEFDDRRSELQAAMRDVSELRARAKQGFDDAIAALELGHARLLDATHILDDHSLKTKLQNELGSVEHLLRHAKSNLSGF